MSTSSIAAYLILAATLFVMLIFKSNEPHLALAFFGLGMVVAQTSDYLDARLRARRREKSNDPE